MPVNVIGTLKPKNNGKFPVAEAVDIKVTEELRLDEALEKKADLETLNYALVNKADKTTTTDLQNQINNIVSPVTEDAEVINARVDSNGVNHTTLKERLDSDSETVSLLRSDFDGLHFYRFNVFDKDDTANILKDKYSVDGSGSVEGENIFTSSFKTGNGYLVTPVFEVKSGDVIRSNGNFYLQNGVYADSTGTITGRTTASSTSASYADFLHGWTVPSNVKYVRLIVAYSNLGYDETLASLMITVNNALPSAYVPHSVLMNDDLEVNLEVSGARTDTSGVTHDTLQARLDSDSNTVAGQIDNLESTDTQLGKSIKDLNFYRTNIFDKTDTANILKDKYSSDNSGSVVGENIFTSSYRSGNGYLITPVFEVKENDIVRSNGNFYNGSGVYADETGTITGRLSASSSSASYADLLNGWTVPNGVKYVRLIVAYNTAGYQETLDSLMITVNRALPSSYVSHTTLRNVDLKLDASQIENLPTPTPTPTPSAENQWNGLIAASLGSSLSQMGEWDDIVKAYFGFSKFYNRGVGSSTLTNFDSYGISYRNTVYINNDSSAWDETNESVYSDTAKTGYTQATAYYCGSDRINTLPTNADLVIVDLATNDAYQAIQNPTDIDWTTFMGQQSIPDYWETANLNTAIFEGAFYKMIQQIQTRCPNARIVVWGMLFNNLCTTQNGYLDKYYEMYERIEKLCRLNGVVFIDTLMYEGANWFNFKDEYHTDSVHPQTTNVAVRGVANAIIGVLRNTYPKNYLAATPESN